MDRQTERRLAWLDGLDRALLTGQTGLEKESLRVDPDGTIAQTPHPRALGSALTHPSITTDYSEALLELVTAPHRDSADALAELDATHRFVYAELGDELLWAASMPCVVDGERSVPIAEYGVSNEGVFKHVYRRGLGYRYGKTMQVIAGLHFNYSLPDAFWPALHALDGRAPGRAATDAAYFRLLRNVHRHGWLLLYLFGASPAVCRSFLKGREHALQDYDATTFYLPYATSLRMSGIGYSNKKRCGLKVCYDDFDSYLSGLAWAVTTPCLPHQVIGVRRNGGYRQLNDHVLQIANEYYSNVRPKQPAENSETPLEALRARGVRYVELRTTDLNPFAPNGIDVGQMRFLEAFLLYCLLADEVPIDAAEQARIDANQSAVANRGRDPELRLRTASGDAALKPLARSLLDGLRPVCAVLDRGHEDAPYTAALQRAAASVDDPDLTPSARVLATMHDDRVGFFHFAKAWSERHRDAFRARPLSAEQRQRFVDEAARSLREQRRREAADTQSFDEYLEAYMRRVDAAVRDLVVAPNGVGASAD